MRMLKPAPTSPARRDPAASPALRLASVRAETPREAALVPAVPATPVPAAAPAAAAPVHHAQTWFKLLGEAVARQAATGTAAASLLPLMRADTGAELLELQHAVGERVQQLQQDWWQGWAAWIEEFSQLRRADTLSEYVEQQYNLGEQFTALLKSQAADLLDLQDNVQVNYGYWAAQKLAARAT